MAPQLQAYIDELNNLALHDAIQTIANLFPGLTGSVSPTCTYLIKHPDYEDEAHLNDLGQIFLACARRCTTEHASCQTRLVHHSLDEPFEELYGKLWKIAQAGYKDGSMVPEPTEDTGCACCRGDPDATILAGFHHGNAFYYEEQEYRDIWGDEDECGSSQSWKEDGTLYVWLMASEEQVELARARTEVLTVASGL
ncbi:hypothetical protein N7486_002806 [Penicillium sp. IBT 16267x]|nr:hypothetical protein N7486_002806 [Penicillium sp. IBT 16267x]